MRVACSEQEGTAIGGRTMTPAPSLGTAQPLARPAAFMATPMALLPSSMNFAKPAPSAHDAEAAVAP